MNEKKLKRIRSIENGIDQDLVADQDRGPEPGEDQMKGLIEIMKEQRIRSREVVRVLGLR